MLHLETLLFRIYSTDRSLGPVVVNCLQPCLEVLTNIRTLIWNECTKIINILNEEKCLFLPIVSYKMVILGAFLEANICYEIIASLEMVCWLKFN